jgi:hypothetical protein
MADRFTHCGAPAEASWGSYSLPGGRRQTWRAPVLGLLAALLSVAVVPAASVSASAPVHVTFMTPNAGPTTGGVVTVTINGSGFQGGAQVKFCDRSVSTTTLTAIKITAVAPAYPSFASCLVEVDNPDLGRSPELVSFNYYEQLPSLGPVSAAGAATHDLAGDAQVDVFVRGVDNNLHHTFHTNTFPSWSAGENLGGVLTSGPTAVSWGNQNRIDVFVKGSDDALWHKWWNGGAWSGWEGLGGSLTTDPLVTSWSAGRLDVFVGGTDHQLWHRFFAGSWSGWEPLGGFLSSSPGGVSWGPNRVDVFVQGTDQAVWHKWWDGARWDGWESLHGSISKAPAATSRGSGDLEVYALGAATDVYHQSYSGGWLGWRPEGPYWSGPWGFSPAVTSQGFVIGPEIFMVGGDQTLWHGVTFGPHVGSASSRRTPPSRR